MGFYSLLLLLTEITAKRTLGREIADLQWETLNQKDMKFTMSQVNIFVHKS